MLPDHAACLALMDQYGMLPNIREHSLLVAQVAVRLAQGLHTNLQGSQTLPDLHLCHCGGILHDLAKTPCLTENCDHARRGAEICRQQGWPDLAEIVGSHVILPDFSPERSRAGIFSAAELVYYADKRVNHDKIVSLSERLAYILARYGGHDPRKRQGIMKNFTKCQQLEAALFSFLDFLPEQLADAVHRGRDTN
jgi:putative nucleotidyltransferase with HDIG domain